MKSGKKEMIDRIEKKKDGKERDCKYRKKEREKEEEKNERLVKSWITV